MAEVELAKAFKDLPIKIQTSSLKERRQVIQVVCDVLSNPGINEQIIRGLCRAIQTTLLRYRDTTSQSFVLKLIENLVKQHREWMLKHFTPVLADIADQLKNLVPSQSTCQSSLYALRWSCVLIENGLLNNMDDASVPSLVSTQALLLMAVNAHGKMKKTSKADSALHHMWIKLGHDCERLWLKTIVDSGAEGPQVPIMAAAVCRHFESLKKPHITEYKDKIIDIFIKSLISVKIRPNPMLIEGCFDFLRELTSDDFKNCILPALQKSMLRNPEIIIEAVGYVVINFECDLDPFAVEITKNLIGNLHSKEEVVRSEAAKTCNLLATKISEPEPIRAIVQQIFDVFNGSNGKLTLAEHKAGVLLGAGLFSCNSVTNEDGYMNLYADVSKHFFKALETESHEKTLCYCLEMLTFWSSLKITGELPDYIIEAFKKGINLKTSTQLVKISYLQWLGQCFNKATVSQKNKDILTPILVKSVEKAIQQPLQTTIVSEGACAAYILLKLDDRRELPTKHPAVWNAITSKEKQVFLQERFLSTTTDDVLISIVYICHEVLKNYSSELDSKTCIVHRALVSCLLSPVKKVRDIALHGLRMTLLCEPEAAPLTRALVLQLAINLESNKSWQSVTNATDNGAETCAADVLGKAIIEAITTICSYKEYSLEDRQLLAVDALLACHHPLVIATNRTLWLKMVKYLDLQPRQLISLFSNNIKNSYIAGFRCNDSYNNVISTLVEQNPEVILPSLMSYVTDTLEDPELLRITRDEYFTYLTPEGELYDKSVIPGSEDSSELNMKRESKAYSFKDQQEELQLRRELEERKRLEGKNKTPKELTAKQKDAIRIQTNKENLIRQKLTMLEERLNCVERLVTFASHGDPLSLGLHAAALMRSLLAALRSPLAAPSCAQLILSLRRALWPADMATLGDTIAHVTLRLYKPQCDLDPNWEEENLKDAVSRTIELLHCRTVFRKRYHDSLKESSDLPTKQVNCFLNAPAFCYCFNLLRLSLTSSYAKSDEKMVTEALQIISHHAKLRDSGTLYNDLNHPGLLPIRQMFQLLLEVISRNGGRIQSQSSATLLEVATAVSGEEGCGRATPSEIDCLLSGLQNPSEVVRDASLRALICLVNTFPSLKDDMQQALLLTKRLWIAKFDVFEENQRLAETLWSSSGLEASVLLVDSVTTDVTHPVEAVQRAAASALSALLQMDTSLVTSTLDILLNVYKEKLNMIPPKLDEFGHVIEKPVDEWGGRRGVALALVACAPHLGSDHVARLVHFFVSKGLGDRAENVRLEMFNAAMAVVDLHGKTTVGDQLPVFEEFLDKAPKTGSFDVVRQAVVILVGSLARHLSPEDPRIKPITLRLVAALSTPSQPVQEAVSNCLPHLITSPILRDETTVIVNKLMQKLLKAEKYGERKGAAYGLAGVVKGLGILALKQLDIMTRLTEAIQDKKNYKHREGALFAFEMLCTKLGRLFEPYIVHVLPHLLLCFGDSSQYVRTATDDTAKVVMSKLSAHGVKLVLPSLLAALEDDSWRTKTGSIELLGAMAYCAPKQLSSCLPSIVPKLIEVLSDSHVKVQEAGAEALKVIGSVIRNPEIQAIVPPLLEALQDPSNKTSACLQTLLDTQFVHFIDAPSLALIMPVVQRAFMDRSTETRKMAAQIIGNMYSLTDQKDLMPYLPNIIPGLKSSLLDPVPEVRSVSARALGAMVRGMGEASFEDLLPWLMQTLTSESSSVDRSGAAQGLSEVVAGLGVEKLHKLMPDIIATSERTDIAPHVKDGYIMMFIYMPGAFTNEFTPYIGQIINPILKALADENEYVRDTALKAGQRIVNLYADSAIMLLLPELEKGLFDDDWRIRYSSVQLLGDLLYRISGVSGKMSTETASEDDNFGTEQSHSAIMVALGAERRNRVLAGLYMGRSDVALMVRQAALHVWKVVVTNTPRTLREILPTLFGLLLGCLASTSFDKRQVAARTLGDLVRKLGERVLPEIIPILERGLQSDRADQRQGVCIGLSEIMASTSKDMVLSFVNSLVPTVRKALCDPLPEVRCAAAKTFDSLHATVGVRALDDILPAMLNGLNNPDPDVAEATLDGLRQVMAIKSRVVLPYLVPQLSAPPVNTKALSILASVAGDALTKYLHKILPALLSALCSAQGTPGEARELEYCRGVVLSVNDEAGVRAVMDALLEGSRAPVAPQRRAAATLLAAFCSHTRADYTHYIPQLLRGLIHLFGDEDQDVLQMAWEALQAVTKSMDAEQQIQHVSDIRQAVRYAVSDLKGVDLLPGFCLPKGITPILPLFRESILNGLPEEKEAAALMLGEVIRLTSAPALQPSVVHITGPLIRILGDRFNASVKAAVLETLALLLAKVGVMLKQFLPQLQTTFLKALNDPNRQVRIKAGYALSQLVVIHTRADPLFVEMHNGIKNSDDLAVKETMLQALRSIITGGGDKMSESLVLSVLVTLTSPALLGHSEDPPRSAVGGCLGALLHCLPEGARESALLGQLLCDDAPDWTLKHGRSCAIFVALKEHPETIFTDQYQDKVCKTLLGYLASDKVPITCNGIRGIGYLLRYLQCNKLPVPPVLLTPFARTMNHANNDVKQLLARVCTMVGRCVPPENMAPELLKLLLPTLVNGTKEKNGYVKANSEIALITVLRLRQGEEVQQRCLQLLEVGACESLNDVVSKVLKKALNQPEGKEEELDCTLIT